jgi:hypothetical protein
MDWNGIVISTLYISAEKSAKNKKRKGKRNERKAQTGKGKDQKGEGKLLHRFQELHYEGQRA